MLFCRSRENRNLKKIKALGPGFRGDDDLFGVSPWISQVFATFHV